MNPFPTSHWYNVCIHIICIKTQQKVFDIAATNLLKVGESVHWGGGTLEYMILDKTVASKGGLFYTAAPGSGKYGDDAYGKQFAPAEVSKEARDDAKARELWELSDKLLGASSSA